mgnify:CR=1 FL=1
MVLAVFVTRAVVLASVGQPETETATRAAASTTAGTSEGDATATSSTKGATTATDADDDESIIEVADEDEDEDEPGSNASGTQSPTGVKSPWTESGTYTSGDATLDEEVKEFCDGIATTDMDIDTALLEVYKGIAWSDYVERDDAQHPSGKDWRLEYARQYYEHDCSGNCYEFASFLGYCLQYMGLSDAHAEGVLVELESGGWGDHGIVYVTNTDGTPSICDTARGTNGWMLKESAYNVQMQDFEDAEEV